MPRFVPSTASADTFGFPIGGIPQEYRADPLFPPATVLPGDDLHLDPEYPPQTFTEFRDDRDRASRTHKRNTIYLVRLCGCPPPPHACSCEKDAPSLMDISSYISAYYYGIPVRVLPPFRLEPWEEPPKGRKRARKGAPGVPAPPPASHLAVRTPTTLVRTRVRSPSLDGLFARQLHVSDILDACVDTLPADGFSILCVSNEDIFDQDDDDEEDNLFTCGRAYGGSRIACVSAARYRPTLDVTSGVLARLPKGVGGPIHAGSAPAWPHGSRHPHAGAVAAAAALPRPASPAQQLGVWLSRVCKTAAHELGHCAGLDHCCYGACAMQGSAHLQEDLRTPPFLCPVDLRKILFVTGGAAVPRYEALLALCERDDLRGVETFAAFAAWLRARLAGLRPATVVDLTSP